MSRAYDYLFKLLLIGDSGVGKTSVILRFSEDNFSPSFITTIGIDFKVKTIDVDGQRVKLQIWDTAGQERFRTITTAYYRGAMGIIMVFDVTNERSFENITNWIRNIEENATPDVELLLVGNKCDLQDRRVISYERATQLAVRHNIQYLESSARSGNGVSQIFESMSRLILDKRIQRQLAEQGRGGASGEPGSSQSGTVALHDRKKKKHGHSWKCSAL